MAAEDVQIFEREYGPEQAGQRVGWVSVDARQDTDQWGQPIKDIDVGITIATVGENGARLGYTRREDDGEVRHLPFPESRDKERPADISGFVAVTGLAATLYKDTNVQDFSPSIEGNIAKFVTKIPGQPNPERVWFDDEQDCLNLLMNGLKQHGMVSAYRPLYYYLNAYLAHAGVDRSRSQFHDRLTRVATKPQAPIADPEMIGATSAQRDVSIAVETELKRALNLDKVTLGMFDKLSGVNPSDLPERFEKSRRHVSSAEKIAQERANELTVRSISYTPISETPFGREGAFMDPTPSERHPNGNYARAAELLRDGNSMLVAGKLKLEIDEFKKRMKFAEQGTDMFTKLLLAELERASED